MFEHLRREAAEIAGLGLGGELHHVLGMVAEHGEHLLGQRRAGADAVIGKQGLFQQVAADAARRCPGRRPGSPSRRWPRAVPCAGPYRPCRCRGSPWRRHPAPTAPSSAISASVSTTAAAEGQDRFQAAAGRCRHWRRPAPASAGVCGISSGSWPASMKASRAASTMFARAPVRSVRILAAPLLARPTMTPSAVARAPCNWCRRHRCRARVPRGFLLRR